jgi:hypothetical protein
MSWGPATGRTKTFTEPKCTIQVNGMRFSLPPFLLPSQNIQLIAFKEEPLHIKEPNPFNKGSYLDLATKCLTLQSLMALTLACWKKPFFSAPFCLEDCPPPPTAPCLPKKHKWVSKEGLLALLLLPIHPAPPHSLGETGIDWSHCVTERTRREFRCPLNCAISFFLHQVPTSGLGPCIGSPEDVGAVWPGPSMLGWLARAQSLAEKQCFGVATRIPGQGSGGKGWDE